MLNLLSLGENGWGTLILSATLTTLLLSLAALAVGAGVGGVIAAAMEHYFPGQRENFWQWIPDPGHGYTISFAGGKAIRDRAF